MTVETREEKVGKPLLTGSALDHTFVHTHNLLHYYKTGNQSISVELLDNLRFILCKVQNADFVFYELK